MGRQLKHTYAIADISERAVCMANPGAPDKRRPKRTTAHVTAAADRKEKLRLELEELDRRCPFEVPRQWHKSTRYAFSYRRPSTIPVITCLQFRPFLPVPRFNSVVSHHFLHFASRICSLVTDLTVFNAQNNSGIFTILIV